MPTEGGRMRYLLLLIMIAVVAACSDQAPVSAPPAAPVSRPSLPPIVHYHQVVVIGDSYTEGSDEGGQRGHGWPALVVADLRTRGVLVRPVIAAEGSAGYVARSWRNETFGDIARRSVAPDTELVVFFGSGNDVSFPPESVGTGALAALTSVKAKAPNAKVIVVGPVWPGPNAPEAFLNVRNAVRASAQTAGVVFVDPIGEGWLADTPELIGADQFHPNDEGHKYLAARIAPLIQNALK